MIQNHKEYGKNAQKFDVYTSMHRLREAYSISNTYTRLKSKKVHFHLLLLCAAMNTAARPT